MTRVRKRVKQLTLLSVISYSIIRLVISPSWVGDFADNLWWVAIGIIVSEVLLTIGIVTMLWQAGVHTWRFRSIFSRHNWKAASEELRNNRRFWTGFWISLVGGLGDGVVLIIAIVTTLPLGGWGVAVVPFLDLWSTLVVRKAIYDSIYKTT